MALALRGEAAPRPTSTRGGLTLVEMTVTMGLIAMILLAVGGLHLNAIRYHQDVAASNWANFDAAQAMAVLEEDIQSCFRVIGRYDTLIALSMPQLEWNEQLDAYLPTRPLAYGESVRYYLSDDSGLMGRTGTCLWRAHRDPDDVTYTVEPAPLAENISRLEFTYEMLPSARSSSVGEVELIVGATVKEGGTTRTKFHTARVVLRNAHYGPVTNETGVDGEEE